MPSLRTRVPAFLSVLTAFSALGLATPLYCQWEIGVQGGIHADRADRADRFLVTSDGARFEAAQGEATVWGARGAYWFHPRWGIEADVSHSHNESWFGAGSPPSGFANTTTYFSARAVGRTAPTSRAQLFVAAGPALMRHGGTGTSYRARDTDIGGVLEAGVRLRLAGRLGVQVAVSDYLYWSRYALPSPSPDPLTPLAPPGRDFQHDLLIVPGLVWSWR